MALSCVSSRSQAKGIHSAGWANGCSYGNILRLRQVTVNVPREQFVDAVEGMHGDPFENVVQIRFRVETIQLRGAKQRQDRRGPFATFVGLARFGGT